MPRPLANAFFPATFRLACGVQTRPLAIAHLVALDALASPFSLGGAWEGGDLALAAFCLALAPSRLFDVLAEISEAGVPRALRKIMLFYARDPAAARADAESVQTLLQDSLRGWRTYKPKEAPADTGLPLAAAMLARALPLFGGDLSRALACPVALAIALLQSESALRGGPKIMPESVQAELDAAKAAAKRDLPKVGKKQTDSPGIGKAAPRRAPGICQCLATLKAFCQGLAKRGKAPANG